MTPIKPHVEQQRVKRTKGRILTFLSLNKSISRPLNFEKTACASSVCGQCSAVKGTSF